MHFLSPDTAVIGRRGERDQEPQLHAHPQVAAAVIGSAVVGGAISSSASKSAAKTQAGAADRATASQNAMFDRTVALNAPFRQSGVDANSRLSQLLGIGTPGKVDANGNPIASPVAAPVDPITQAYRDLLGRDPEAGGMATWQAHLAGGESIDRIRSEIAASPEAQAPHGTYQAPVVPPDAPGTTIDPSFGSLNKPFSMEDFQLDPGIKFQTEQGNLALTNSMAAKNGSLSGGALKALIGYNQGMAGLGYQSAFDRYMAGKKFTLGSLMDVSKTGQAAASGVTSAAPSFSSGIAGTITGAGNAQAAGTVGSANAISGGIQGAGNGIFLNSLLNNQNGDLGGPITTSANPGGVYTAPSAINTA